MKGSRHGQDQPPSRSSTQPVAAKVLTEHYHFSSDSLSPRRGGDARGGASAFGIWVATFPTHPNDKIRGCPGRHISLHFPAPKQQFRGNTREFKKRLRTHCGERTVRLWNPEPWAWAPWLPDTLAHPLRTLANLATWARLPSGSCPTVRMPFAPRREPSRAQISTK